MFDWFQTLRHALFFPFASALSRRAPQSRRNLDFRKTGYPCVNPLNPLRTRPPYSSEGLTNRVL